MKEFVELRGAGAQVSIIRRDAGSSAINSDDSTVLQMAAHSKVSNLAVHNFETEGNYSVGITLNFLSDHAVIQDVEVRVEGPAGSSHRELSVFDRTSRFWEALSLPKVQNSRTVVSTVSIMTRIS